jgi:hypothetical protein
VGKPGSGSGMRDESPKGVNSAGGGVGVRAQEAEKRDLDKGSSSKLEASMELIFTDTCLSGAIVMGTLTLDSHLVVAVNLIMMCKHVLQISLITDTPG